MSDPESPNPDSPENVDAAPAADEPATLAPDDAVTETDSPTSAPDDATEVDEPTAVHLPVDIVPGLGEPAGAETVTPDVPAAPAEKAEEAAPSPEAARGVASSSSAPPADEHAASVAGVGSDPPATTAAGNPNPHGLPDIAVDRPEVAAGAAFAGGLLFAMILERFAG